MNRDYLKNKYLNKQRDLSEKSVRPSFPKIVKIDVCNTCNYSCIFCPQAEQHNKKGCIDIDLCYKIIDDAYAAGARELCLSMTGEPLLNKELENYVAHAKKTGYTYVFFNTNGYLLTEERSEKLIKAGLDSIKVSVNASKSYALVHGIDAFNHVVDNIKAFDGFRHRKIQGGGIECALYISYVAVRQTQSEVQDVKDILSPYVDEIIVMNANGRGGSATDSMSELYSGNDEYSFVYPCSQLFNNIYVTAEGYMVICCQDFENLTVVADLNQESITSAWTNGKFTEFRKRYLEHDLKGTLCQNCLYGTSEKVIPLTPEKAGYDISVERNADLMRRVMELKNSKWEQNN